MPESVQIGDIHKVVGGLASVDLTVVIPGKFAVSDHSDEEIIEAVIKSLRQNLQVCFYGLLGNLGKTCVFLVTCGALLRD